MGPTSSPSALVSPLVFISHALWDLWKLVSALEPQSSPLYSGRLIPTWQSFGTRQDTADCPLESVCVPASLLLLFSPPHPTARK